MNVTALGIYPFRYHYWCLVSYTFYLIIILRCYRQPIAAALYSWPTADSTMRTFRRNSLPSLPQSLQELANKFENGELHRFQCCNSDIFQGCVTDSDGNYVYIKLKNVLLVHLYHYISIIDFYTF